MSESEKKYEIELDRIDAALAESQAAAMGLSVDEFLSVCIESEIERRLSTLRESISADDETERGH